MIHSKTVINRIGSGKIIIKGKSHIIGNASMEIDGNGNVFVNGKPLQDYEANYTEPPVLKIEITGTVQHIETENADIQVNGNVGEVVSKNGNVSCQTVEGSVTSKNGNVSCSVIKGDCDTKNGNIMRGY